MPPIFCANRSLSVRQISLSILARDGKSGRNKPPSIPDVYHGHHVIRRGESYWSRVSPDQTIEQELMASVKRVGGLTRGRGMTEIQRAKWLLSTPTCAEIENSVRTITGCPSKQANNIKHDDQREKQGIMTTQ